MSEPKVYDEWEDDGNFYRVVRPNPRDVPHLEIWGREVVLCPEVMHSTIAPLHIYDPRGAWHETDQPSDIDTALARLASLAEQLQEVDRG